MGETAACKKKPRNYHQNDHKSRNYLTYKVVHPRNHGMAGIAAKSSAEECIGSKQHGKVGQHKGRNKCSADYDECSLEESDASVPEKETIRCSSHDEYERKASKSEETAHEEVRPRITGLAGRISHVHALIHHIRLGHEALICRPCKKIGNGRHKGKDSKDSYEKAQTLEND